MMRRNIELEARLIDDLLDLTRISHGKLAIMPVATISVESDGLGRGAKFTIALESVDAPTGTVSGTATGIGTVAGKPQLLIVEDHETTRTVLTQLLTRRSHQVTTAVTCRRRSPLTMPDLTMP